MRVFKFGGASVKDADAVKNVVSIVERYKSEPLAIVVSAMGKTTNALERVITAWYYKKGDAQKELSELKAYHKTIMDTLFTDKSNAVYDEVNDIFVEIDWVLEREAGGNFDMEYDQVVSIGEMVATKIVSAYLNQCGIKNKWLDARDLILTDDTYRDAKVDWPETEKRVVKEAGQAKKEGFDIVITQGFIGVTAENTTTTLGREGSDYTGAILAYCLNAKDLTIWKDVPGVLNADPKWFDNTQLLDKISYREAIELAYYGATVIHPKTIKPLQNKAIALWVKSFVHPERIGTVITQEAEGDTIIPSFIFKIDQVLISISPKDFSFIIEENLSDIFDRFAKAGVKVNLLQNSAINFSVCVNNDPNKIPALIDELKKDYRVLYNEGLELITIRHYDDKTIERVLIAKQVLVTQLTRVTARYVVKPIS